MRRWRRSPAETIDLRAVGRSESSAKRIRRQAWVIEEMMDMELITCRQARTEIYNDAVRVQRAVIEGK